MILNYAFPSLSRAALCPVLMVVLSVCSSEASAKKSDDPTGNTPSVTLNLRDFGAVGDAVTDDGPALQSALNSLASSGGGTLFVPAGRYALVTPVSKDFSSLAGSILIHGEPSSTPIDFPGNGSGLNLASEFIVRVGSANDALSIRRVSAFTIKDIAFVGDLAVTTDARRIVLFQEVENASIEHSEFYGLASLVAGGAIVFAQRSSLKIDQTAFLGCSTNSGHNASMIENLEWKAISISNSKFIDYGNRPNFFSKTPLAPPYSWIGIGNAAAVEAHSLKRDALIQTVLLDEGAFIGISSIPARYTPVSAPFGVYISGLFMNVTNLGASGNYFAGVKRVFIEKSHYGWSHRSTGAISLSNVNESILDLLTCIAAADRIAADAGTQRLVVLNSIYQTLDSAAPYTRVITTADPMDDPVQYVRQQYLDVLSKEPSLPALYYWADRLLRCEDAISCLAEKRVELSNYLGASPTSDFVLSGKVTNSDGAPIAGVTVNLTGSAAAVTQTDAQGNYSFGPISTAGIYTLNPTDANYAFFSQTVTHPVSNQVLNFIGTLSKHSISGRIVNQYGNAVAAAQVALSGSRSANVTTNASGDYSFSNLPAGGNYTVTVSRNNYTFAQASKSVTGLAADQTFDFLGTLASFSIGGKVQTPSGAPIVGATITVTGTESHSTTTDVNGNYLIPALRAEGNYTLTVSSPTHMFVPESVQFNNLNSNQTASFTSSTPQTISGRVAQADGSGVADATVRLTGSSSLVVNTNSLGDYSFIVGAGGNYSVTPEKPHYSFTPANLTFTNVSANQVANFTATARDIVSFSNVNYMVTEGAGFVEITVSRSGDTSSAASVRYTLHDGTASQVQDYTLTAGILHFSPGETSKTFNVLITNDAYVEAPQETVNLVLSDPSGFLLGSQNTAVLTIVDNNTTSPTTNPIEEPRAFVNQHYDDFLGRTSDPGGLDYWTAQIESCGNDQACILLRRVGVSAAFFVESEFQQSGGFVYRVIKSMTGQLPDYSAFMLDRGYLVSFGNVDLGKQLYAEEYVSRPEFVATFPTSLSNSEFIDGVIARTKQSTGVDLASQRDFLLSEYTANENRGQIVRLIADNPAVQQVEFNRAFVLMQYFGYLRRNPDPGGYGFWLSVMSNQQPGNHRGMVCAFLTSAEFQQRFSQATPRTNQDCAQIQ